MSQRTKRGWHTLALAAGLGGRLTNSLVLATEPAAPDPGRATRHEVSHRDKSFAPGELTIGAGDEVVFLNDDEISHNVFSRSSDAKFNLKIQRPGEHKAYRFEKPGKSVVRCAIHPHMKLVVNVVEDGEASSEQAPDTPEGPRAQAPAEVAP